MKSNPISFVGTILLVLLCTYLPAQNFGPTASAVWITDCNQSNFFNTSGDPAHEIGPSANIFDNASLGIHTQNSGTLILRGAQLKTFKNPASSNVCNARMFYRVYLQSAVPGAFSSIDLPFLEDCDVPNLQFPSGGVCQAGDQKWQRVIADGTIAPYAPVNLTTYPTGSYVLEVYYELDGSQTSTTLCNDPVSLNNAGNNYKAYFSIQSPAINSTNPSTCNGTEGSIIISGLTPNTSYQLSYNDDGAAIGPVTLSTNASGQLFVTGLNAGLYSNFSLEINGCTTNLFTGVILSNPIFVPTFTPIAPFCAGTANPVLPTTSNNGVSGTWSPATVNNQATATYTFTPNTGQCGLPVTLTVNVIPRTVPTFSFGTSLSICAGGTVPVLPNNSTNGMNGTWSPAVVSNQNSGTYTFTPNPALCASPATFTVTVTPNITPTFAIGSSLAICAGGTVPALPASSGNGITGIWSPAVVDNQNSGVYTFTPGANQCATTATYTVTVNPNIIPTFPFGISQTICAGETVPVLTGTSTEGITGTWNPATVSNQTSGNYTFTPAAGQCALITTLTVTIQPNITPTFSFGTTLTICAGGTVPVLPNSSTNGITGTWSPAVADNQASGTYTFTPTPGLCATSSSFTVTVTPNITPTFAFGTGLTTCAGSNVPVLTNTSSNGITGTWSPATVSNQTSASYTFTPTAGLCAVPTTFTTTILPNVVPIFTFGTSLTICAGESVPALPGSSTNGINGTWSPAVASNQQSGTYTFTPAAGACATATSFTITVTPNVTPTFSFGTTLTICAGGTVPALPGTSGNGIAGTWSPATVDNQTGGTYTFTPAAGICALPTTFAVTVNPNITPTFPFGTGLTICAGGNVPALINTSSNGIAGTWSPATADNQNSATYTFTPAAGECAVPATFTVTVSTNIAPVFSFGSALTICAGGTVPALPTTSTNTITGTWSPAVADNQASGTYTFTPTTGQCALPFTYTITVTPNITPAFSFGTSLSVCEGSAVPALPGNSTNGVSGTWSPAIIDNQTSGTYTFTPTAGECAISMTLTVTVNPNITPDFSFGPALTICAGGTVPALPATSPNGITGTWSPATIDNQQSGTYTFTPTAGQCVTPAVTIFTVTVTPNQTASFSFGTTLSICTGGNVPLLPTTSDNGLAGTWSPAVVSTQTSGSYVFTPAAGSCVLPYTYTVTVNPILDPSFSFGTAQSICIGGTVPVLPATSTNGVTGVWSPAVVDNQANGTYTFTPNAGQCANTATFTLQASAIPTVNTRTDTSVVDGSVIPAFNFMSSAGSVISWTNSLPAIGLAASGTGAVPSFTAINLGTTPVTATITLTPTINGCTGQTQTYTITVLPLDKEVFVPNVFSPNRDGKNDLLMVYGNYINTIDMRIFNQWGQQIASINNKTQGWDGTHKGTPQPVGVYVYVLKAVMADGRIVNKKGSITLIR